MNLGLAGGLALTVVGLAGYSVGIIEPYPGRALSLTVVMVGITVALVSRSGEESP